jgi:LmbE family N-acetylglucosaminyl deacetylase
MRREGKAVWVWLAALACLMNRCPPAIAYDWLPPTNKIALLAVCAHADDEGIFFGGALPYYSTVQNLPTMLLCMTAGWGDVRDDELRCAAWKYGMRYEPLFGRFVNINSSAVTNNPYTNTIDMTWDYWAGVGFRGDGSDVEAGKARAINLVAEQIRRYRPDVIITHDLNGEYGHDNHKATAYAVTRAFFVAADPSATATNLVGLPPWQAKKLYVHLYPLKRFFHEFWEVPYPVLTNQTPRQVTTNGLTCHLSQGPLHWIVGSVYAPTLYYSPWPSEWWGLYASMVGPDSVLSSNLVVNGYTVPSGVAAGDFLEHASLDPLYQPPTFTANPLILPPGATYNSYNNRTLADYIIATDPIWTLTFGRNSGPAWLSVAANGTLTGTAMRPDLGTNSWIVTVTNQMGLGAQTTLTIPVLGRPIGMENLVGWWKLSETNPASLVAANSAPLSLNGVSYGGTIFGQPGARPWTHCSAQFNGIDGKIDVPYSAALNPPVFTVSLWANVMGGSGTYRSPLTNRKSQPQAGYIFYANMNDLWQFWTGNGSAWTALTAGPVVTNTWIHLAATYDGTTVSFYTNGTLAAAAKAVVQLNDTFPLRIGAGATEGAGALWFPGRVDDVRVYRVALDAAHVWSVFATPPVISNIRKLSDGTMLLGGAAFPEQTYVLLSTPSGVPGVGWMPVATNVADTDGYCQFIDLEAMNYAQRSYRLVMP